MSELYANQKNHILYLVVDSEWLRRLSVERRIEQAGVILFKPNNVSALTLETPISNLAQNSNDTYPSKVHQFKPGQSGNPGGRPRVLSDAYKRWLSAEAEEADEKGLTNADMVAKSLLRAAKMSVMPHSVSAAKELRSAVEGDTDKETSGSTNINVDLVQIMMQSSKGA